MKQLLFATCLALSTVCFGQGELKQEVDLIQSIWGKAKQEIIKEGMSLKETDASAFWPVYDAYELERKVLGEMRLRLINDYVTNFETLTDEKTNELVNGLIKNNIGYEKLYAKYFKKVKKSIGTINAAKFIQMESALQTAIKSEMQEAVPFIGAIERARNK
jgi:hypothetical protein